jgi:hypothetical protein
VETGTDDNEQAPFLGEAGAGGGAGIPGYYTGILPITKTSELT